MSFLRKVEAALDISALEQEARKQLAAFWRSHNLPLPRFKIVNNPGSKWLARTTYKSSKPDTTTIEIQKRVLNDLETVKRLLGHELVHHLDFLRNPTDPTQKNVRRNPHDQFFMKEARRINTKMGKDWITKVSDQSYVTDTINKDITVVLYNNAGKYGFAITMHPTTEQKKAIRELLSSGKARVMKTRDSRFSKGPTLTAVPQFMIPKDYRAQRHLKQLYQKASRSLV